MAIVTTDHGPMPLPTIDRWSAILSDTYDGAPDSKTRGQVGWGATEGEAVDDLLRLLSEDDPARVLGDDADVLDRVGERR